MIRLNSNTHTESYEPICSIENGMHKILATNLLRYCSNNSVMRKQNSPNVKWSTGVRPEHSQAQCTISQTATTTLTVFWYCIPLQGFYGYHCYLVKSAKLGFKHSFKFHHQISIRVCNAVLFSVTSDICHVTAAAHRSPGSSSGIVTTPEEDPRDVAQKLVFRVEYHRFYMVTTTKATATYRL